MCSNSLLTLATGRGKSVRMRTVVPGAFIVETAPGKPQTGRVVKTIPLNFRFRTKLLLAMMGVVGTLPLSGFSEPVTVWRLGGR